MPISISISKCFNKMFEQGITCKIQVSRFQVCLLIQCSGYLTVIFARILTIAVKLSGTSFLSLCDPIATFAGTCGDDGSSGTRST